MKIQQGGSLFQSSHSDIPIKQSASQLITAGARREKQIPRHETRSVWWFPALMGKKTKQCCTSFCFCLSCSSYLPEYVNVVKKKQGISKEVSWRGRAVANLFDCHQSLQEVSHEPSGNGGQRSQTPGVLSEESKEAQIYFLLHSDQLPFIFFFFFFLLQKLIVEVNSVKMLNTSRRLKRTQCKKVSDECKQKTHT